MSTTQRPVTAVIPARNEEAYISECVKSVLADPQVGMAIVVCDRCTDDTPRIVSEISRQDSRCIMVDRGNPERPLGGHLGHYVAATLNAGLKRIPLLEGGGAAHYVAFVDADTRVPPEYLSEAVRILDGDEKTGCIGLELDGNQVGTGSCVRYSIIERMGGQIRESARNDTCMHLIIKSMGYGIKFISYHNDGILLHTSGDDGIRRKVWGAMGIGYASYEYYNHILLAAFDAINLAVSYRNPLPLLYIAGWISAFLRRAGRVEELKGYSHPRYMQKKKAAFRKLNPRNFILRGRRTTI